jgi:hypothetical protein
VQRAIGYVGEENDAARPKEVAEVVRLRAFASRTGFSRSRLRAGLHLPLALLLTAGVLISGCGTAQEPVFPVSGQILWSGKPLAEAVVVLHPEDGKRRSLTARTDASGRFQLTTHQPGDGAPAGTYLVTVEYRDLVQEGDELVRHGPNQLPARYAKPETSGLRCEVTAGTNTLPVWNLEPR